MFSIFPLIHTHNTVHWELLYYLVILLSICSNVQKVLLEIVIKVFCNFFFNFSNSLRVFVLFIFIVQEKSKFYLSKKNQNSSDLLIRKNYSIFSLNYSNKKNILHSRSFNLRPNPNVTKSYNELCYTY